MTFFPWNVSRWCYFSWKNAAVVWWRNDLKGGARRGGANRKKGRVPSTVCKKVNNWQLYAFYKCRILFDLNTISYSQSSSTNIFTIILSFFKWNDIILICNAFTERYSRGTLCPTVGNFCYSSVCRIYDICATLHIFEFFVCNFVKIGSQNKNILWIIFLDHREDRKLCKNSWKTKTNHHILHSRSGWFSHVENFDLLTLLLDCNDPNRFFQNILGDFGQKRQSREPFNTFWEIAVVL